MAYGDGHELTGYEEHVRDECRTLQDTDLYNIMCQQAREEAEADYHAWCLDGEAEQRSFRWRWQLDARPVMFTAPDFTLPRYVDPDDCPF